MVILGEGGGEIFPFLRAFFLDATRVPSSCVCDLSSELCVCVAQETAVHFLLVIQRLWDSPLPLN